MPIGAALGGAAIAGVGSVAAGAMGASAQRHAANQAADTSRETAQMNNDLFREIYGRNEARLDPYSDNGLLASNALSDLLLGTHNFNPNAAPSSPAPAAGGGGGALSGFGSTPPSEEWANGALQAMGLGSRGNSPATLEAHLAGRLEGQLPASVRQAYDHYVQTHPMQPATPAAGGGAGGGGAAGGSALSAWDQFRQGTNYNWRFNEGMRGVTGNFATRGALDSGAAEKAKIKYGQNFASNELSNYMNLLAGQQNMGLSAAGAIAGVGNTYAGNVAAQNTNAANAAANAALAGGNAQAGMYGAIGNGVGQLGGALFQYGMAQQFPTQQYASPASSGSINVNPNPNYQFNIGGF